MKNEISIQQVYDGDKKAQIVSDVLSDLPGWFGLPDSTKEYIEDSRTLLLWAAKSRDEIIGFVTLKSTSEDTAEPHCMGVKKAFHRLGAGTLLYHALEKSAKINYKYLQEKTTDEKNEQRIPEKASWVS